MLNVQGYFSDIKCTNPDGSVAWEFRDVKNGITNAGLNYIGGVGFSGTTQITTWYSGLIGTLSSLLATDTMSSHPNWSEFTGYSGTRPTWTNTTAGQQVSSSGSFSFPITSNGVINGIFITSSNTIGGSTGTLWCTAQLPQVVNASTGQVITGQYNILLSGG